MNTTFFQHACRRDLRRIEDVDAKIDRINAIWQGTVNPVTRRDCDEKLEVLKNIRNDLLQLSLFAEEVVA